MDLIAEIKYRCRIDDLIFKLAIERGRKSTKGFFIKSIYKDEKTPSLQVNCIEDTYYCFSTGKGGDVIQFYQDFYRIEKSAAIKELAKIYGIENNLFTNQRSMPKPPPEKKKLFELVSMALLSALTPEERILFEQEFDKTFLREFEIEVTEHSKNQFNDSMEKILKPVRELRLNKNKEIYRELRNYCMKLEGDSPFYKYLVEKRKLDIRKLMAFKLFYIIDYWKVNNHLKKAFPEPDLRRAGLLSEKGNLIFYNHRLIIPYLHHGEIVYMRGRYFDNKNETNPASGISKYIGLVNDALDCNRAKRFFNTDVLNNMLNGEKLLIVEGELDSIAGETLGFNTIAIPGANNIPAQNKFKKLLKYDITICGDNDEAGNGMADKLKNIFISLDKEIKIKTLPSKDINDLLAA